MSQLLAEAREHLPRADVHDWIEHLRHRRRADHLERNLLLAGAVVVGLGLLAAYYVGPDVKRYMKLRNM